MVHLRNVCISLTSTNPQYEVRCNPCQHHNRFCQMVVQYCAVLTAHALCSASLQVSTRSCCKLIHCIWASYLVQVTRAAISFWPSHLCTCTEKNLLEEAWSGQKLWVTMYKQEHHLCRKISFPLKSLLFGWKVHNMLSQACCESHALLLLLFSWLLILIMMLQCIAVAYKYN